MTFRALNVALALAIGCAPTLHPDDAGTSDAGSAPTDGEIPSVTGAFQHTVEGEVVTTIADATDDAEFRYLDLESAEEVNPARSHDWDLAFSRFHVRTNGGVSGTGGVRVAALIGQDFDSLTNAPVDGWSVDREDGEADEDTEADNAFNNGTEDWYLYDIETHTLTPRDVTYVIETGTGRFYKLRFESYYDDAGTPAIVRFRWAEIGPPDGQIIDASDREAWVYLRIGEGVVTITDPLESNAWDLAFRRAAVRTNSGSSGPGMGGAIAVEGSYEEVTDASTFGFTADALAESEMPGGEPTSANAVLDTWFDYDIRTHTLAPRAQVFAIRAADGRYARLRIWSWDDGLYRVSIQSISRRVEVREIDVDASVADSWVYLSLRGGAPVAVTEPASDSAWDLAISRTRMRTNSGTSGEANGAALETLATAIAELGEAPAGGWIEDAMIADGPPGSPEFSGNPALAGWYDYDPATHIVSPRAIVFALRTADGHFAKLQVRSFEDGRYRIAIAYAGPGHTTF